MGKKIAVGLSGGVDSSVAAYLLIKEGYDVTGIWMDILGIPENSADAERVADFLKIPFHRIDISNEYRSHVIDYIRNEYSSGKTPNPCIFCNRNIKFGALLDKALESGINFDYFATGHFANLVKYPETGRFGLKKGLSDNKDQVYFLSMLKQDQLKTLKFPLGNMTKPEVRRIAKDIGLFTAIKKESQDLCTGDYRQFISNNSLSGSFVDVYGNILGKHRGIGNYTIGQRRGLGISSNTEPYYVVEIKVNDNTVVLGFDDDLKSSEMSVKQTNWFPFADPELPIRVICKIRYRDNGAPAVIQEKTGNNTYKVVFDKDRRAITPGQIAVFYNNDEVTGAGVIV